MKNTQLATIQPKDLATPEAAFSVQQILQQIALVQQVMNQAMKEGEHWGKVPGCGDKPTLLKPGAEKLCLTFRLAPTYDVQERILEGAHREYRVTCSLTSILTGAFHGQGVGICSTMEAKYRYRGNTAEVTDKPLPRMYWDLRQADPAKALELIGGKGFSPKKVDGQWFIAKAGEKAENENIADAYNTILKMSKKRALVDAVLTATAASDCFTQDLEDISANLAAVSPQEPRQTLQTHQETQPAREVETEPVRENTTPRKHPASKPIQGENVERWDCQVGSVSEKQATSKAGKPYTRYTINLNTRDGIREVSTIEEYVADKAYALNEKTEDAVAVVEKGQYGYKLLSFDPIG